MQPAITLSIHPMHRFFAEQFQETTNRLLTASYAETTKTYTWEHHNITVVMRIVLWGGAVPDSDCHFGGKPQTNHVWVTVKPPDIEINKIVMAYFAPAERDPSDENGFDEVTLNGRRLDVNHFTFS